MQNSTEFRILLNGENIKNNTGEKMKKAYIKVILGFCSGRNIITPGNKVETVGRRVKYKILMFTQKAKNIVNTP